MEAFADVTSGTIGDSTMQYFQVRECVGVCSIPHILLRCLSLACRNQSPPRRHFREDGGDKSDKGRQDKIDKSAKA